MIKSFFSTLAFIVALVSFGTAFALTPEQQKAGADAAETWLKLVDDGKYDESWDAASPQLQLTMNKDNWKTLLTATRAPLGAVSSRTIAQQDQAENPQGLPAGSYLVLLYKTTFAKNVEGQELVTLTLGQDNNWKVLTYLVKGE